MYGTWAIENRADVYIYYLDLYIDYLDYLDLSVETEHEQLIPWFPPLTRIYFAIDYVTGMLLCTVDSLSRSPQVHRAHWPK